MTDASNVIAKIKTRGYWRVKITPVTFQADLIASPGRCREIVQNAAVMLRGWDYPHVPRTNDNKQDVYMAGDKVESWIDWEMYREGWRLYQSGQFIHFFGMLDDWYGDTVELPINEPWKSIEPKTQLDALETIYRLTEVFVFLRNLCGSGVYDADVRVEISLHGCQNRRLTVMDPRRLFFDMGYICRQEQIDLPVRQLSVSSEAGLFDEVALELAEYLYHQFQWDSVSKELFKTEQQRILTRNWW